MSDDTTGNNANGTTMTQEEPPSPSASAVMQPPAPPVPPAPPATGWSPHGDGHGHERGVRTGGAVFGVLLVLAGLFALFGGFTSVYDVVRLWPLLIVFGGLMQIVNPRHGPGIKRVAEGLGTVSVGLVLLANTFGYIPWTVWLSVISLWPLLIVALGIELVGRGLHMNWLRAMSNVLLILGLAYAVFVLQPTPGRAVFPFAVSTANSTAFADSRPHDGGVSTGSAVIKVGASRLTLGAGDALASIGGTAPRDDVPTLAATVASGSAAVTVAEPSGHGVFVGTEDRSLNVTLDRALKWSEVRLDVGAVTADADLSGLAVSSVQLNAGASDSKVRIGTLAPDVSVDISGGAMSVTVLVPASAACNVEASSGLSNVSVPPSFRQTSGIVGIGRSTFVSDGSGGPKITISLDSGVSDLHIETY